MADVEERRYASRKFLLACATALAGHLALGLEAIHAGEWLELMKWTLGLYFGANVGALAVDLLKRRNP